METGSKDEACEAQESAGNAENASLDLGIGTCGTPQRNTAEVTPRLCTSDAFQSPMNFSSVTVEQLGITPESFVKSPAGKSSYLKKSRRRSTVGARGSPETNHLIRFIAQQRNLQNTERSPLVQNSPFQRSPGLYQNVNSLRQRISAFQSAFYSIKENEKNTEHPEFAETGGFMSTHLTPKGTVGMCQKSGISAKPPKRRRLSSPNSSDENCTDTLDLQKCSSTASPYTDRTLAVENCLADPSENSSEIYLPQAGCLVEAPIPFSHPTSSSSSMKVAGCAQGRAAAGADSPDRFMDTSTDPAPEVRAMVIPPCGRNSPSSGPVMLRSVLKKPSAKQFVEVLQEHCDNLCEDEAHPNLISNLAKCCKERKSDQEDYKEPAFVNLRKRKRVTFGEDLSPEVFDESLPANTPLRKGGTPVCKKNLGNILDQSPVPEHLPQPNFDDNGENLENIEPLQVAFAVLSPLSSSSISETLSGTDPFSSSNNCEKISPPKVGRVTRTSKRRSQLISIAEENVSNVLNTEVQPCKENKMKRRRSQESKRPVRVHPKKNQALKSCRKKKGRPKKAVQKSLYGERDIASKKPLLSPIPELPEFLEVMPSVPSFQWMESDDFTSNGELEEMKLPERNSLLPENPEDLLVNQGFNCDIPEFCSSYLKSPPELDKTTFDQDLNIDTREVNTNENISNTEITLESAKELKTGTENHSLIPSASPMEQHVDVGHLKRDFICQPQAFSVSSQNVENIPPIFKISEDEYVKCEKQDDVLVSADVKLLRKHLMPVAQNDFDCSDGLTAKMKESQSEELATSSAESSQGSCRNRKQKRPSQCYSSGQSLPLEKDGNQRPCVIVETNLENLELYKDLSDSIEQTFQRASSKTKVRRSTRLQKDLKNEGLVWVSPPSYTSQKTKRRTIGTFSSSGVENLSSGKETVFSGQTPWVPPVIPSKENRVSSSALPGKRRKSFCTSVLENIRNTTQSERRMPLNQKGEKSLNVLSEI